MLLCVRRLGVTQGLLEVRRRRSQNVSLSAFQATLLIPSRCLEVSLQAVVGAFHGEKYKNTRVVFK